MTAQGPDRSPPEDLNQFPAKYDLGDGGDAERIRQGMRAAVLLGGTHHARGRRSPLFPRGRDPFTVQTRYWLTKNPRVDPVFDRVIGSLVPGLDIPPEPPTLEVPLPRADVAAARRNGR